MISYEEKLKKMGTTHLGFNEKGKLTSAHGRFRVGDFREAYIKEDLKDLKKRL